MTNAYVTTGTMTDGRTLTLDQSLPVTNGPVRVVVEPLPKPVVRRSLEQFVEELRARQAARGYVPMSAEEVDAHIKAERASWGDD